MFETRRQSKGVSTANRQIIHDVKSAVNGGGRSLSIQQSCLCHQQRRRTNGMMMAMLSSTLRTMIMARNSVLTTPSSSSAVQKDKDAFFSTTAAAAAAASSNKQQQPQSNQSSSSSSSSSNIYDDISQQERLQQLGGNFPFPPAVGAFRTPGRRSDTYFVGRLRPDCLGLPRETAGRQDRSPR
jgi:hypothetical protein